MSRQLISRSPDLKRLEDDGYEIEIIQGHIILHNVPYVDAQRKVRRGNLVSVLDLSGDRTVKPGTHVVMFAGEHPCDSNGTPLRQLEHSKKPQVIAPGVVVDRTFSCKPNGGDTDYHHKMTTYAAMISGHAEKIDPSATARTFQVLESDDNDSPFNYIDNASSRAGITAHTKRLELSSVAIVGLGGTGSYLLDFVSKTPVKAIHLFDGDWFGQHNAFRAPGAATVEELRERLPKVDYFQRRYAGMHRGIVPHAVNVDEGNVGELRGFDFVFLTMDANPSKEAIIRKLEEFSVPFIDTGMGIEDSPDGLRGILRVTTSTPEQRGHVWDKRRIPMNGGQAGDEYSMNIQVADLNALNAALAVGRWKRYLGFYADLEGEHFSTYTLDGNHVTNEDQACPEHKD